MEDMQDVQGQGPLAGDEVAQHLIDTIVSMVCEAGEVVSECQAKVVERLQKCTLKCRTSLSECRDCVQGQLEDNVKSAIAEIVPIQQSVMANLAGQVAAAQELVAPIRTVPLPGEPVAQSPVSIGLAVQALASTTPSPPVASPGQS